MNDISLINEIIDLLGNEAIEINSALIKTKILLHQIKKKELAKWVDNEINGYSNESTLPAYRLLRSKVFANVSNGVYTASSHPIPIGHLTPEQKENLEQYKVRESVSVLEHLAKQEGSLARSIPMEVNYVLDQGLSNGFQVQSAWCGTPTYYLKGILAEIRSRLLDFVLELKSSIGDIQDEDKIKEKISKTDTTNMFNSAIFGSNTTIIFGNQNIQNKIEKGNIQSLLESLTQLGVPSDEIQNLEVAIKEDEAAMGKISFEGKTGGWMARILSRITNGGIDLTLDVASKVITKALSNYMGLP